MNTTIKNWAEDDRPRERLLALGAETLSKAELLAILIGSGGPGVSAVELMRQILADYGDSLKLLGKASVTDLMRYKHVGEAKAVTILAACQLAGRRMKEELPDKLRIDQPKDAFLYFLPHMQELTVEECHLMMLNNAMHVIDSVMLSHGGLTGASVDIRELLRWALLRQATSVVLCHNHPSGNIVPSRDDDNLTKKAQEACRTVGIRLVDHIIIGGDEYYSYNENSKL